MAELVSSDDSNIPDKTNEEYIKSESIRWCVKKGKHGLEISDVGVNEGFFFNMKKALIPNYREVISNPEDLVKLKANFDQIKSCLQERSGNHPVAIKLIDACEAFADNGQLSDYKDCLLIELGKVWHPDWIDQDF